MGWCRLGPDGVLTFALPIRGDYPVQWLNPYTAVGPVGASACGDLGYTSAWMHKDTLSVRAGTPPGQGP